MKILITGSSGMLGSSLYKELSRDYEVVGLDIAKPASYNLRPTSFIQCDITEREKIVDEIVLAKPDIAIHAAAYTDVDGCEQNPEQAHRVNALGTENVAQACKDCNCLLIYISTDFVFDGEKKSAYIEEDPPNPINIYGKSKLEGEKSVQSILKEFIIVRSSWLFGEGGRNFVDILLKRAQNEKRIEVVNDQFGSPTYTKDLAQAIKKLIDLSYHLPPMSYVLKGIYHITNSGSCSWYEFASAIKEFVKLDVNIVPVSFAQYPSPTKRPKMSVLENRRYRQDVGEDLRNWKEALEEYIAGE